MRPLFALALISLTLIAAPELAAMDLEAAREQACDEFNGRWSGTGCNGLGVSVAAFRRRVEALSGHAYERPEMMTLANGAVVPRATVVAYRRCVRLGGEWRLTGATGSCSK